MKANDFVKKFGWEKANTLVGCSVSINQNGFVDFDFFDGCVGIVNVDNLKRLVESYELVDKVGGLENAKTFDRDCMYCISHLTDLDSLKNAIADVESCQ